MITSLLGTANDSSNVHNAHTATDHAAGARITCRTNNTNESQAGIAMVDPDGEKHPTADQIRRRITARSPARRAVKATREWLLQFAAVTRAAVVAVGWPPRSCIAMCRVGLHVLRYFDVAARAEPVRYDAYTPEAFAWRLAGLPWPPPVGRVLRVHGTGAFDDMRWDGHLVLIVDTEWLVDLSLEHPSPPDRSLTLAPAVGPLPTDHALPWQAPGAGLYVRDDGTVIRYQPMTDTPAAGWRAAIDWVEHDEPRRAAAGSAIRVLRTPTQVTADGLHAINSPAARRLPTDHMTLHPLDHRLADRLT